MQRNGVPGQEHSNEETSVETLRLPEQVRCPRIQQRQRQAYRDDRELFVPNPDFGPGHFGFIGNDGGSSEPYADMDLFLSENEFYVDYGHASEDRCARGRPRSSRARARKIHGR